jgi:hypothetical protein
MKRKGLLAAVLAIAAVAVIATGCSNKPRIKLSKTTVGPGDMVVIDYTTPKGYQNNAWIGIIPSEVPHGNETRNDQHDISYKYLKGSTSGTLRFTVPKKPGKYDFRMHDTDNNGLEVASVTFEVVGKEEQPKTAEVTKEETKKTATKAKFGVGDKVMVEWKGSWWPAKVIKTRDGNSPYRIHYDGYSNSWDEWVSDARIKNR